MTFQSKSVVRVGRSNNLLLLLSFNSKFMMAWIWSSRFVQRNWSIFVFVHILFGVVGLTLWVRIHGSHVCCVNNIMKIFINWSLGILYRLLLPVNSLMLVDKCTFWFSYFQQSSPVNFHGLIHKLGLLGYSRKLRWSQKCDVVSGADSSSWMSFSSSILRPLPPQWIRWRDRTSSKARCRLFTAAAKTKFQKSLPSGIAMSYQP